MQNRKYVITIIFWIVIGGCYKEKQIPVDEIFIAMTGNKSSIPADGVSKQLITIELPSLTTDASNSIVLTTTKGVFDIVNKNTTTVTAQNVIVDGISRKIASTNLISSTDEGTAYVTASIKNYSQTDTIFFTPGFTMNMTGNPNSIPADGVSKQLITIELPSLTTDANNSIVLTTTKGLFDIVNKNTTTVTAQNVLANGISRKIASVNLISATDEGYAYVTASIKNYSQTDTILFTKAYPEEIKILVDKLTYQISNSGELTVTVKINRLPGNGVPSQFQTITLTALDNERHSVGKFRNFNTRIDAAGTCINYFSIPQTNPYKGDIKFLATVQSNSAGKFISDSTIITSY